MRRRRIVVLALAAPLVALAAATARYVVWPKDDEPGSADAVVVLAGDRGERIRAGTGLMEDGVAPLLLVSQGGTGPIPDGARLCGDARSRWEVVCFRPDPDRTQGEARVASRIAEERGLRSLVVVTSTYHVTRARLLFERCFDGEVRVVGARPDSPGGLPSAYNVAREWAGFAHALLVERDC